MFNAFERSAIASLDEDLKDMILHWDEVPTALQIFRVIDEIKLMRSDEAIAPYILIERFDKMLEQAMIRENITYKELSNRALWRDQDF